MLTCFGLGDAGIEFQSRSSCDYSVNGREEDKTAGGQASSSTGAAREADITGGYLSRDAAPIWLFFARYR
jgi:hypothetical protein